MRRLIAVAAVTVVILGATVTGRQLGQELRSNIFYRELSAKGEHLSKVQQILLSMILSAHEQWHKRKGQA